MAAREKQQQQTNKPVSKFPLTIWKNYPTSAHKPECSHTEDWAGDISLFLEGFEEGLPCWLRSKESSCNAGDAEDSSAIPALGRSPEGGNGNPHHHFCRDNPMDRGACQATVMWSQRVRHDWACTPLHIDLYIPIYIHTCVDTHMTICYMLSSCHKITVWKNRDLTQKWQWEQ